MWLLLLPTCWPLFTFSFTYFVALCLSFCWNDLCLCFHFICLPVHIRSHWPFNLLTEPCNRIGKSGKPRKRWRIETHTQCYCFLNSLKRRSQDNLDLEWLIHTHKHTHNHHVNAQLVEYVNYECSFVNLLVNFLDHSVADSSIYVHCVYGEIRSEIQLSGIKNKRNPTSIHFVESQHMKKSQREYRQKRKSAAVEFRAILCADFLVKSLKTVNNLFVRSN